MELRRDLKSKNLKSLKAIARIDKQIIITTVDTGNPVSFLNWTKAKQILELSQKATFVPAESIILPAQIVGYKKHPIMILGALKWDI